jgi:hypothetical protein
MADSKLEVESQFKTTTNSVQLQQTAIEVDITYSGKQPSNILDLT